MRCVPCPACTGYGHVDLRDHRDDYMDGRNEYAPECPECEGSGEFELPLCPCCGTRSDAERSTRLGRWYVGCNDCEDIVEGRTFQAARDEWLKVAGFRKQAREFFSKRGAA